MKMPANDPQGPSDAQPHPAQLRPLDLAARGLRQLLGELDDPRVLVGSGDALRRGPGARAASSSEGSPSRSTTIARTTEPRSSSGAAHGGGLGDGGVGDERGLDLEGPDPVAGGDDHVVVAALEPEVAVLVLADLVAGRPPLAVEGLGADVVAEEGREVSGLHLQLAVARPAPRFPAAGRPIEPSWRGRRRRAASRSPGRSRSGRSRRGSPAPSCSRKARITSGLSGSPAETSRAQRGDRPQLGPLGEHPVLGRRLAEDVDALALERSRAARPGSKRASWMSAAAPLSQGAMKTFRVDFDQPVAAVHQASSPVAGAEPVLGLQRAGRAGSAAGRRRRAGRRWCRR